jgi:hypothetical protein
MSQLKDMHESTDDKDKELMTLRKKLESMVKLTKVLKAEQIELQEKVRIQKFQ